MDVPYFDLGSQGIRSDLPNNVLPPGAWTGGLNTRVRDGQVLRTNGYLAVFGVPQTTPYALTAERDSNGIWHWVYFGATDVWEIANAQHAEITRASGPYTGSSNTPWNTCRIGRVPVYNNGVDVPQYWSTISSTQLLQDLPGWPAAVRAKVVRPFKQFLLALNVTDDGISNPHELRWSHPAAPGTIPTSWDYTDPTLDAGRVDIGGGGVQGLVDCLPLRGENILYKETSVHTMRFVGGQNVFAFDLLFDDVFCLGQDCVVPVPGPQGARHFVLGRYDIVLHDGVTTPQSVLESRVRKWFVNNLNPEWQQRSFCMLDPVNREAWACIPTGSSEWPNKAITWNWDTNACMIRDLPLISARSSGLLQVSGEGTWDDDPASWDVDGTVWDTSPYWDSVTGTWDEQNTSWNLYGAPETVPRVVAPSPANNKLYVLDFGPSFDGSPFYSYVERLAMPLSNNPASELPYVMLCQRLWLYGTGEVVVTVGAYETGDGAPVWKPGQEFDFSTSAQLPAEQGGRHLAFRMSSAGVRSWSLANMTLEVAELGKF